MAASLTAATLSGCADDRVARIATAAAEEGKAKAEVDLPAYPPDCRRQEPHAPLVAGAETRSALKRERGALDRQNARTDRCAGWYDALDSEISEATAP